MTDENITSPVNEDGDKITNTHTVDKEETQSQSKAEAEAKSKQRSVSFNRDVHVKRFGKPREVRGGSSEHQLPSIRKEPFTHLSEKQLIEEANKVLAQADSVTCTADHPPEKFFSLPHRRKLKPEVSLGRRNSDDLTDAEGRSVRSPLGRSTSDVTPKKRGRERTSLSTLFRRAQRTKSPDDPVVVATKPVTVKRSKSDVSDLKSNTTLNTQPKPIRKRSGSETEEFLKSLRNKKTQLSPIIESSPRDDYFKKTPPLEAYQKQKLAKKDSDKAEEKNTSNTESNKINPIEKPPRYKVPELPIIEPKPPARTRRGKSLEKDNKDKSPSITETPKRKTEIKKKILVDEIDCKGKNINPAQVKERIKESIKKIQQNIYGSKEMIHSSQQPPDKPPLTRGNTVDHLVQILKEDQLSPPPKAHLISLGSNINQPFSYTRPSTSPDPNLYIRSTSPDRVPSPVNKMNADKGIVYAQVVKGEHGQYGTNNIGKQTIHKTYSPIKDRIGNYSDEDEGLGNEDQKNKFSINIKHDPDHKNNGHVNSSGKYRMIDSPIKPRFREYKLTSFDDFEPTYANEYPRKESHSQEFIDSTLRGRADGMDSKRKNYLEPEVAKVEIDFNELTHRRQLLESRLNARKYDRDRIKTVEPITRYITETDPIYEAEKRMKATEKYVNETARYYRNTLERDGFVDSSTTEDYNRYDSDNNKVKYNTESRTFEKVPRNEIDRREFIDTLRIGPSRFRDERTIFPPEPEYEPPSLESHVGKPILTPDEYTEKKYKVKNRHFTSSHDMLQSGQKYTKSKDEWFGKRKGHYASNPEIAQEREDDYANARFHPKPESYHNSLKRVKNRDSKDKYYGHDGIHRHDSGDSRDYAYHDDRSPRRFDIDSRLVDSGIENDFRKDSSGEIHRTNPKYRIHESDEDVRNTSLMLASERRHTEDNYPSEQIYANGEYITRFEDFRQDSYPSKSYVPRERSADDGSHFDPRIDRAGKSPTDEKVSTKPPKATKKLSGLEKVKQLFSRDSSKKSKKEKEVVQNKTRTRVLKSPEHLARDDPEYRRYRDPEPSDDDLRRKEYDPKSSDTEKNYRREERRFIKETDLGKKYRDAEIRDSDPDRPYREPEVKEEIKRYDRELKGERTFKEEHREVTRRRYKEYAGSSEDRDSDHRSPRPSDIESELKSSREPSRKSKSKTAEPLDSPALAERYRERRRLATPSPTPSPPPAGRATNWFKSLDRLARKRATNKVEKESAATTEDEPIIRKSWSKPKQPLASPAKNLRFFGDTDPESDAQAQKHTGTKTKANKHSQLRKTVSNSSTGIDETDHGELSNKSYSLTSVTRQEKREDSPKARTYKRNLHNISEIHSNSETESHFDRKPPISPYDRRSRSHSSSKNGKTKSRSDLKVEDRGSSSELRGSKQELTRDLKQRRRTPAPQSGESSTEGDSSHQSQRSVVYLHATTVGDIPDPGRLARNRSRDDVSSVNSSQLQVRTTTKSFSIFAPWSPRHHDHTDVHYAQRPRRTRSRDKDPKKTSSTRNLAEDRPSLQKNKSYSQTTLTKRTKPQNSRLSSSNTTLYRKPEKRSVENLAKPMTIARSKNVSKDSKRSQSTELLNRDGREKVSRSISMPKDNNKKSGWFKLSNKNKKPEVNTRVR